MQLELFKRDTCPYCLKVMHYLEKTGRCDVTFTDISLSPEDRARLTQLGGKPQVPCLVIDGEALYESDDIISWLEKHPQF